MNNVNVFFVLSLLSASLPSACVFDNASGSSPLVLSDTRGTIRVGRNESLLNMRCEWKIIVGPENVSFCVILLKAKQFNLI